MRGHIIGLNMKSLRKIPFAGALFILAFFLPFISIAEGAEESGGKEIIRSGFQVLGEVFGKFGDGGPFMVLFTLLLGVSLAGIVVSEIILILKPGKRSVKFTIYAYIFSFAAAILVLFTAAKAMPELELMPDKFLIKYLGVGYWLLLLSGLVGLVCSLRAAKINPGYIILVIMSILWLFPIAWIIMISFRGESGSYTSYFWPKEFTLKNYSVLLTDSSSFPYVRWFGNTLLVASCSCILTTFIVLSTAFTLSRIRFSGRKLFMNLVLILGMFPGFMSMIAVYYILKGMGLTQSLIALILVYSGGAAMGYYIAKGFFDTIPKALDEAACIDGATKWQVFTKVTMPLSKPIIIYTVLTSFMGPWADFIFAKVIMGDDYKHYTVALGLYSMLSRENIDTWYTRFAGGAVLISIPIAILFITLQKYYVEGLSGSVKG